MMNIDKASALLELKSRVQNAEYVNQTRQGDYGRGFAEALAFVYEIIDDMITEYLNKENSK